MSESQHPVWSLPAGNGQLLLTPCPGTKEVSLEVALKQLKNAGASTVITLMTAEELAEQDVADIASEAENLGLIWMQLPIEDEQVPDAAFEVQWDARRSGLGDALGAGEGIAIHCKGGSGRTGLIAARLLLDQGQPLEKIIPAIQALRPRAFYFQTQRDYIQRVSLSSCESAPGS